MKRILFVLLVLALSVPSFAGDISKTGIHQGDLYAVLYDLVQATAYRSTTDVGLSVGTTTSKIGMPADSTVLINGEFKTVAAGDITFTTGHTSLTNSQACIFLVCNDGSAMSTVQGRIVASTETPECPRPTAGTAAVGYVKIVTAANGVFVPTSTALSVATITDTYVDFGCYPPRLTDL
jgi:hypothetical protein